MRSCSAGSAFQKSRSPNNTSPRAGAISPTKCFKSVLLPQPLPPMMMKISPRRIVKLRSRCMTKSPYAMSRFRTVMCASGLFAPSLICRCWSDSEGIGQDGEDAVRHNDEHDAGHHRGGCGETDGGRATAALDAAHATGKCDQNAEHRALADADGKVDQMHAVEDLVDVLGHRQIEHTDADQAAPQDAHQVCVNAKKRHHEDERDHPRENEKIHRRQTESRQRVDFLVDL